MKLRKFLIGTLMSGASLAAFAITVVPVMADTVADYPTNGQIGYVYGPDSNGPIAPTVDNLGDSSAIAGPTPPVIKTIGSDGGDNPLSGRNNPLNGELPRPTAHANQTLPQTGAVVDWLQTMLQGLGVVILGGALAWLLLHRKSFKRIIV